MINFFYEIFNFKIHNKLYFIKKIIFILKNEKKKLGNINYIFCDDNYLLKINKKYLKKNYYTDVISFNYSFKKNISGDIFISIERVIDNSTNFNETFLIELERVMIHAILHFLGYNDNKDNNIEVMRKKENFYLYV